MRRLPLCVAVLSFFATGCADDESILIHEWEIEVPGQAAERVHVPTRLDVPHRALEYRLRAKVQIPTEWAGKRLSFALPFGGTPGDLRVNGEPAVPQHGVSLRDGYRLGTRVWAFPPESVGRGEVELELTVRHQWQMSGWLLTVPRISPQTRGGTEATFIRLFNHWSSHAALWILLTIAFTSAVLFLLDRRNLAHGWLAVESVSVSYFFMFLLGMTGWLGVFEIPFIALGCLTSIVAGLMATYIEFGQRPPIRRLAILWTGCTVACAVFSDPFFGLLVLGPLTVLIVSAALAEFGVVFYRAYRADPATPNLVVRSIGMGVFSVSMVPAAFLFVGWPDPLGGLRTVPIGLIVFALSLFIALTRRHLMTQRLAERRHAEIEVLNVELRRQIAERSEELAEALARLGTVAQGATELSAGEDVDGRYRVVRSVGSGAMGAVYEVERTADGKRLAMKVLTTLGRPSAMARFAREAQIAAKLSHPNLVDIHDVGFAESGFMYLVMEYVDGQSLIDHRERFGDVRWGLRVLKDVALGLEAIHAEDIVHRDLKPANVLVPSADHAHAKIADFGISGIVASKGHRSSIPPPPSGERLRIPQAMQAMLEGQTATVPTIPPPAATEDEGPTAPAQTWLEEDDDFDGDTAFLVQASEPGSSGSSGPNEVIGTPAYMAPERVLGRDAGPLGDVFGFGVLAYQVLTGSMPFEHPVALTVLRGSEPPPAPRLQDACPPLPQHLAAQLQACLDFEPGGRPTAQDLARALELAVGAADASMASAAG